MNINTYFVKFIDIYSGAPAGKRGLAAQGLKDFFNHSSRGNTFLFLEC
jgi:hypothetical protein